MVDYTPIRNVSPRLREEVLKHLLSDSMSVANHSETVMKRVSALLGWYHEAIDENKKLRKEIRKLKKAAK